MSQSLEAYLVLSVLLFGIGVFGFLSKRNAIAMLMSIELMLNAVNLAIVAYLIHCIRRDKIQKTTEPQKTSEGSFP